MPPTGPVTVTLVLTPDGIRENDGVSTVTAVLNPAASEPVTASAVAAADAEGLTLSANRESEVCHRADTERGDDSGSRRRHVRPGPADDGDGHGGGAAGVGGTVRPELDNYR